VKPAFFYDTWGFIALSDKRDAGHDEAVALDEELEQAGFLAVTSDYVLDETLTFLSSSVGGETAVRFLDAFEDRVLGGDLQVVEIGKALREVASSLFRRLAKQERRFSFTDATSFAVMHELGIVNAFTADQHFHRAGRGVRPLVERRAGSLRRVRLT
jgi:predicted nucleic acid-binding protein